MTNREQLATNFPDHMHLIEKYVTSEWLSRYPNNRAPKDTLAAGFEWSKSDEGHDFWDKVYNSAV